MTRNRMIRCTAVLAARALGACASGNDDAGDGSSSEGGAPGVADREARLADLLEVFPVLGDKLRQPGGELAGGQQQMLTVARGLMGNPSLLLLDEPSLGLSPKLVGEVIEPIARVREQRGTSLVLVEQNVGMAADLTERTYVVRRGRLVREEPSKDLFDDCELLETYVR